MNQASLARAQGLSTSRPWGKLTRNERKALILATLDAIGPSTAGRMVAWYAPLLSPIKLSPGQRYAEMNTCRERCGQLVSDYPEPYLGVRAKLVRRVRLGESRPRALKVFQLREKGRRVLEMILDGRLPGATDRLRNVFLARSIDASALAFAAEHRHRLAAEAELLVERVLPAVAVDDERLP